MGREGPFLIGRFHYQILFMSPQGLLGLSLSVDQMSHTWNTRPRRVNYITRLKYQAPLHLYRGVFKGRVRKICPLLLKVCTKLKITQKFYERRAPGLVPCSQPFSNIIFFSGRPLSINSVCAHSFTPFPSQDITLTSYPPNISRHTPLNTPLDSWKLNCRKAIKETVLRVQRYLYVGCV